MLVACFLLVRIIGHFQCQIRGLWMRYSVLTLCILIYRCQLQMIMEDL